MKVKHITEKYLVEFEIRENLSWMRIKAGILVDIDDRTRIRV